MLPRLVVVSGAPGTGKTALATQLSRELGLPLLAKDTIKEAMMDVLPVPDRATSMQLGGAVFRVLFTVSQSLLDAGVLIDARKLIVDTRDGYDPPLDQIVSALRSA